MRQRLGQAGQFAAAESLHKLGLLLHKQGEHRFSEAEGFLRQAVEIYRQVKPDEPLSAAAFHGLAIVLRDRGKLAEAAWIYREALPARLKSWPANPEPELKALGEALLRERQLEELDNLFDEIVAAADPTLPQTLEILRLRGNFRARRSQFREAAADYSRALEREPERVHDWHCLAVLLVESSQFEEYAQHCRKAIHRFRNTTNPNAAEQIARDCLLLPKTAVDLSVAVQLINFAVSATNHEHIAWFEAAKALVEYRQGHFRSAINWTDKLLARGGGLSERQALAEVIRGLAQHREGQTAEALRSIASAHRKVEAHEAATAPGDIGHNWASWLAVRALLREAGAWMRE
jgi:tetratricopeptide (TPR) repeat protein